MSNLIKYFIGIGFIALLLTSCSMNKTRPEPLERGREWLSWTSSERNRYVLGYLDGYLTARHTACLAADSLFEVGQPHRMGDDQHPSEYPSGRCLESVDSFSRFKYIDSALDLSTYVNVITEFYAKHPEYQGIPVPSVMEFLSDKKCKTAADLFQTALRGELHIPN